MIDPAALGWEDVRAFLAVAERGTLPEAARALGVSAATAGRRLQRLEATLGATLFERQPNRLALTPAGADLLEWAAEMGRVATSLARRAAALAAPTDAAVRVTATGSVSLYIAAHARRLAELAGAPVSVITTKAVLDVAGGEADLALRMRRLPEGGPLAGRRLGRVAFSVYATRALVEAGHMARNWSGLDVIGLTQTTRAPSQSCWLDDAAAARGATIRLRFGDVAVRHAAVRAGAGASLLPCFLGDADPNLVRLLPPPSELGEDLYLLLHERARAAAPVRAVADALAALIRESADTLAGRVLPDEAEGRAAGSAIQPQRERQPVR